MFSFLQAKSGYTTVRDGTYDEEIKLGEDSWSRSGNVTIKPSLYSMVLLTILLLSSIFSTLILFFHARHPSQYDITLFASNGPSWTCHQPVTRREWRSLSEPEKSEYLAAVKCLATKPSKLHNNGTLYDDFPWVHKYLTSITSSAHTSAPFLPWHRYFIHLYEKSLKEECDFDNELPYWDWSLDWSNFSEAPVWDSTTGLGGDGSGSESVGDGRCVTSGPFSDIEVMFYDGEVQPHCLSRGFPPEEELEKLGGLIRPEVIKKLMKEDDYEKFASELEERAHKFLTHSVRGDLSRFTGPNDPIFFLHHVNLDRLWWQWQQTKLRDRLAAYNGRANKDSKEAAALTDGLDMGGLSRNLRVIDVMDTTRGPFCYGY